MDDKELMRRAISLSLLGRGRTNPNPVVGAVIARGGRIIAEGYHHALGDLHAERDALKNARENGVDVSGADMFVTLEPCCHTGRQPPCTRAIIESGIRKVVVGSRDPNPLVSGGGVNALRAAGIDVVQDFLKEECDALNEIFFHYIVSKMPYVILKYAITADGLTATSSGKSKWITGEKARLNVHRTRSRVMAVMAGINTVLNDDPLLNVRGIENARQPLRVVLDSNLRIPLESNLVRTANSADCGKLLVFCRGDLSESEKLKKAELERLGVEIQQISVVEQRRNIENTESNVLCGSFDKLNQRAELDLEEILRNLGHRGIDSVLVESGGALSSSLVFSELLDEIQVYIAPKIFGNDGKRIFSPVRGKGVDFPEDCARFSAPEVEFFDGDVLLKFRKAGGK